MKYVLTIFLASILVGCAAPATQRVQIDDALVELEARKQQEIWLEGRVARQKRLMEVAYPLLQAAVPLCGEKVVALSGFLVANKYDYSKEFQDTVVSVLGLGEPLQLIHVLDEGPAGVSGLQPGDVLVSVNYRSVPTGKGATEKLAKLMKEELTSVPIPVTVVRDGQKMLLELTPVAGCDYEVEIIENDSVNAFANGEKVGIFTGMMRFAQHDQELSLVVAHELAHNAMGHIESKTQNYMLGSLLDILAGVAGVNTQGVFGNAAAQAYSQDFEAEADYVGLYIMGRAGLEIEGAAKFWRRMAAEQPGSIKRNHAASHPATPERFLAIEKTVADIKEKIAAGLPLELEYKK